MTIIVVCVHVAAKWKVRNSQTSIMTSDDDDDLSNTISIGVYNNASAITMSISSRVSRALSSVPTTTNLNVILSLSSEALE